MKTQCSQKLKKKKRLHRVMKSQESITQPKYHNNLSVTNPQNMETCHLLKIQNDCLRKLSELQKETKQKHRKIIKFKKNVTNKLRSLTKKNRNHKNEWNKFWRRIHWIKWKFSIENISVKNGSRKRKKLWIRRQEFCNYPVRGEQT